MIMFEVRYFGGDQIVIWVRGRTVASGSACRFPPRKVRAPWAGCQVTPGRRSAFTRVVVTDSATENTPPTWWSNSPRVRVKWWS